MFSVFFLGCASTSTEPKSLENQCLEDYVADACFLGAVDDHTSVDREVLFGMGAKFGNVASSYTVRRKWPAEPWGAALDANDLPAVYHGYAAACDLGLPQGCQELGNFLAIEGQHPSAAVGPYRKACHLGLYDGCLAAYGSSVSVPL